MKRLVTGPPPARIGAVSGRQGLHAEAASAGSDRTSADQGERIDARPLEGGWLPVCVNDESTRGALQQALHRSKDS